MRDSSEKLCILQHVTPEILKEAEEAFDKARSANSENEEINKKLTFVLKAASICDEIISSVAYELGNIIKYIKINIVIIFLIICSPLLNCNLLLSEISGQSQKVSTSCHFLGTVPRNSLIQITI